MTARTAWVAAGALAALAVAVALAFAVGRYPVAPGDLGAILWSKVSGTPSGVAPTVEAIVWSVRGPRIGAALAVGAALAAAGAAYQSLFRNPLVSPDILGVSGGAAVGAVLGIFLALPILAIQGLAFAFGLVAVAMLKVLADPYNQLPAITFWLLGSLAGAAPADLASALPAIAIGLVPLWLLRWRVNLLSLGDEEARAMGVETTRVRLAVIASATLMTAAAVSISGIIGWIGLVIPHFARLAVGPDFSRLMPVSAILGAAFLLLVDTLARTTARIEIPLGVLTAFVGTPLFLWQLVRSRRSWQ
ncbi:MAG: iron ABC transporter permease [Betaproteobacteria bacterium]|nr:iron ABC transporter permease [Betaproteobacteria bacterium]